MYYKFVKVTNNNTRDFLIDITTMKDVRIRMSILNRRYTLYYYGQAPFHPMFKIIQEECWSFYCCHKGEFSTLQDAKDKRTELYDFYKSKLDYIT